MFKNFIFIFSISLSAIVYADNSVGNIGNIENSNLKNMGRSSLPPNLDVKYTVYNYQMKPAEFAKFLEANNLPKTANITAATNIVYLNVLQKEALNTLSQKLSNQFSNKISGSSRCRINNDLCGGSGMGISGIPEPKTGKPLIVNKMSILFKISKQDTELSAKIITDNTLKNQVGIPNLILLKSEAMLQNIKNKNYIMISQTMKAGILYGQIIQISFSNN